jgi:hypothetical protein
MYESQIEFLQRRSVATERFVRDNAHHLEQQLRRDACHHAFGGPRSGHFRLKLVLKRRKSVFDSRTLCGMPGAKGRFAF